MFDRIRRYFNRPRPQPQFEPIGDMGLEQVINQRIRRRAYRKEAAPGGHASIGKPGQEAPQALGEPRRMKRGGMIRSKSPEPHSPYIQRRRRVMYKRSRYPNKDMVPAILAPGELVIPRNVTEKLAKLINTKVVLERR